MFATRHLKMQNRVAAISRVFENRRSLRSIEIFEMKAVRFVVFLKLVFYTGFELIYALSIRRLVQNYTPFHQKRS